MNNLLVQSPLRRRFLTALARQSDQEDAGSRPGAIRTPQAHQCALVRRRSLPRGLAPSTLGPITSYLERILAAESLALKLPERKRRQYIRAFSARPETLRPTWQAKPRRRLRARSRGGQNGAGYFDGGHYSRGVKRRAHGQANRLEQSEASECLLNRRDVFWPARIFVR